MPRKPGINSTLADHCARAFLITRSSCPLDTHWRLYYPNQTANWQYDLVCRANTGSCQRQGTWQWQDEADTLLWRVGHSNHHFSSRRKGSMEGNWLEILLQVVHPDGGGNWWIDVLFHRQHLALPRLSLTHTQSVCSELNSIWIEDQEPGQVSMSTTFSLCPRMVTIFAVVVVVVVVAHLSIILAELSIDSLDNQMRQQTGANSIHLPGVRWSVIVARASERAPPRTPLLWIYCNSRYHLVHLANGIIITLHCLWWLTIGLTCNQHHHHHQASDTPFSGQSNSGSDWPFIHWFTHSLARTIQPSIRVQFNGIVWEP